MTRAVVFAYSEVGVRCVRELIGQGIEVSLLFTHRDDPQESQWFGSVQQLAEQQGLHFVTPDSPNTAEWLEQAAALKPDFVFSFYYRHMLAPGWLNLARLGALNMHGSLLPQYRGRAPVHWAILRGETETGASLHYMVEKPDAGALVDQQSVPIDLDDDALAVSLKVADAARRVLKRSLPKLIAGTALATPLDLKHGSYFGRRRPEDGRIDWRAGAKAVHDLVRAVAPPFPGAFTEVGSERIQIFKTQMQADGPRFAAEAPCLYRAGDAWYADCFDGRLKILQLAVNGETVSQNSVPAILARLPLALSRP